MGCTYVKEFDFSKKAGDGAKKYAKGGAVHDDAAMDKKAVKTAVHKHEKALHKGEPLTKLAKGGKVEGKVRGQEKLVKAMETSYPKGATITPARRRMPVAPTEPMIAMKSGGKVSQAKYGKC